MMITLELQGTDSTTLHILGGCLLGSRVLHGSGTLRRRGTSFGRMWGATTTFVLLPVMAVMLVL
jgi:uncharacterized membrane protein YecN with MAPEG domain